MALWLKHLGSITISSGAVVTDAADFSIGSSAVADVTSGATLSVEGAFTGLNIMSAGTLVATGGGIVDVTTMLRSTLGTFGVDDLSQITSARRPHTGGITVGAGGTIFATGTITSPIDNDGLITSAISSALDLTAELVGSGTVDVLTSTTLGGPVLAPERISFQLVGGSLTLGDPNLFAGPMALFGRGRPGGRDRNRNTLRYGNRRNVAFRRYPIRHHHARADAHYHRRIWRGRLHVESSNRRRDPRHTGPVLSHRHEDSHQGRRPLTTEHPPEEQITAAVGPCQMDWIS